MSRIRLLDGAMGTELVRQGATKYGTGFTQIPFLTEAGQRAIVDAHIRYLRAGSRIITTHTYTCHPLYYDVRKIKPAKEVSDLLRIAVNLSKSAIKESGIEAEIAGSLGPYGASAEDGGDYDFDYSNVTIQELKDFHCSKMKTLRDAGVDILLFETITSMKEAEAIDTLLKEKNENAWISFCCRSGSALMFGDDWENVVKFVDESDRFDVLGVNCSKPGITLECLQKARSLTQKQLAAYPNCGWFDKKNVKWTHDVSEHQFCEWAETCAPVANFVGGCCCVGPEFIESVSRKLEHHTSTY